MRGGATSGSEAAAVEEEEEELEEEEVVEVVTTEEAWEASAETTSHHVGPAHDRAATGSASMPPRRPSGGIGPIPVSGTGVRQPDALASFEALYAACGRNLEPYRTQILDFCVLKLKESALHKSSSLSEIVRDERGEVVGLGIASGEAVAEVLGPNIKGLPRAREKVAKEYGGDVTRLKVNIMRHHHRASTILLRQHLIGTHLTPLRRIYSGPRSSYQASPR